MRTLIAGNWKMHGSKDWSRKPAEFDETLPSRQRTGIDVLICPPFPYLAAMAKACEGLDIAVGSQDCHANSSGAHTGETSAEMVADCGATYAIVGHSERRAAGESDSDACQKAEAALRAGLIPIICVGETLEQREAGEALSVVEGQIKESVPYGYDDYVIAYEPVWAIGTGKVAEISDIKEMHDHIRGIVGANTRILYGGSVKPGNAKDILATENVNGALIGGASLEMADLAAIARSA